MKTAPLIDEARLSAASTGPRVSISASMARRSCWCVGVCGRPGIATVSSQRRQPSFNSGAQSRLHTIARISPSASKPRREERRARCNAVSIPRSRQSSWRTKTSP